jgi:hypothetical protein
MYPSHARIHSHSQCFPSSLTQSGHPNVQAYYRQYVLMDGDDENQKEDLTLTDDVGNPAEQPAVCVCMCVCVCVCVCACVCVYCTRVRVCVCVRVRGSWWRVRILVRACGCVPACVCSPVWRSPPTDPSFLFVHCCSRLCLSVRGRVCVCVCVCVCVGGGGIRVKPTLYCTTALRGWP